jgi:hypothetical protein
MLVVVRRQRPQGPAKRPLQQKTSLAASETGSRFFSFSFSYFQDNQLEPIVMGKALAVMRIFAG